MLFDNVWRCDLVVEVVIAGRRLRQRCWWDPQRAGRRSCRHIVVVKSARLSAARRSAPGQTDPGSSATLWWNLDFKIYFPSLCVAGSGVFQNSIWAAISFSVVDRWMNGQRSKGDFCASCVLGCHLPSDIFDQCVIQVIRTFCWGSHWSSFPSSGAAARFGPSVEMLANAK